MSTPPFGPGGQQPSEEELRAAYEAEIKRLRVEDVLVQTVVSLINLALRNAVKLYNGLVRSRTNAPESAIGQVQSPAKSHVRRIR